MIEISEIEKCGVCNKLLDDDWIYGIYKNKVIKMDTNCFLSLSETKELRITCDKCHKKDKKVKTYYFICCCIKYPNCTREIIKVSSKSLCKECAKKLKLTKSMSKEAKKLLDERKAYYEGY